MIALTMEAWSRIFFSISALAYTVLVLIVFLKKEKVWTLDNYVYLAMVVLIIAQLSLGCFNQIIIDPKLSLITKKIYNSLFCIWGSMTSLYFFAALSNRSQGYIAFKLNPEKKYFTKAIYIFTIVGLIEAIMVIVLKQLPNEEGLYYTSKGASPNFAYIVFAFYLIFWFVLFIRADKEKKKRLRTLIIFVCIASAGAVLQLIVPSLYITGAVTALSTAVIFLTIGNPDIGRIEELNIARDSALRANQIKSEFLSSISHEIRTPLNAIVGFSESLVEEEMDEQDKEDVKIIRSSAVNLLEIVNGILDISKLDAKKLEVVEQEYVLSKVVNEIIASTRSYMGNNNINFVVKYNEKLPQVLIGDVTKFKNITNNILTNAVKYTTSGKIVLNVDGIINDEKNSCRILVTIEDTGMGMTEDVLKDLFANYQQSDDKLSGSGLGVAVTKKLVELLGGRIKVVSKVGSGTTFTYGIDQKIMAFESNETEAIYLEDLKAFDAAGKKVMIVDDNLLNLKVAKKMVLEYNAEVDIFQAGKDCLEKIKSGAKYDMIMMDDFMPEMNGKQTLDELKKLAGFDIPVIALTANNDSNSKEKYSSEGFNDYLSKPIVKEELNIIMKKYLS